MTNSASSEAKEIRTRVTALIVELCELAECHETEAEILPSDRDLLRRAANELENLLERRP